jgi:hypothetical protein
MFAPKLSNSSTKPAIGSLRLAHVRSALAAGRHGPAGRVQSRASWDFRKVPLLPQDRRCSLRANSSYSEASRPIAIQPKLAVGAVDDPLEREADHVADQVMRMPDPDVSVATTRPQISRKCAACEEEDKHSVQPKRAGPSAEGIDDAPGIVHKVLRTPGQPLDTASRVFFESRFGYDFGRVRIHSDAQSARSAESIGALAYTTANHIVFGASRSPRHLSNYALLAHELAHVVQQGGAAPRGTIAGDAAAHATSPVAAGGSTVHRQADGALSDLNMPAFPCDRGSGVELCNTTSDSGSAPNFTQCLQTGKDVIDDCKGRQEDCLAKSKCAFCGCVGEKYCRCTGIV